MALTGSPCCMCCQACKARKSTHTAVLCEQVRFSASCYLQHQSRQSAQQSLEADVSAAVKICTSCRQSTPARTDTSFLRPGSTPASASLQQASPGLTGIPMLQPPTSQVKLRYFAQRLCPACLHLSCWVWSSMASGAAGLTAPSFKALLQALLRV